MGCKAVAVLEDGEKANSCTSRSATYPSPKTPLGKVVAKSTHRIAIVGHLEVEQASTLFANVPDYAVFHLDSVWRLDTTESGRFLSGPTRHCVRVRLANGSEGDGQFRNCRECLANVIWTLSASWLSRRQMTDLQASRMLRPRLQ